MYSTCMYNTYDMQQYSLQKEEGKYTVQALDGQDTYEVTIAATQCSEELSPKYWSWEKWSQDHFFTENFGPPGPFFPKILVQSGPPVDDV